MSRWTRAVRSRAGPRCRRRSAAPVTSSVSCWGRRPWSQAICGATRRRRSARRRLLPEHLDDQALAPTSVEFAVEHGLPRTEVEPPVGDREHDLVVDQEVLEVRIAVVLAAAMVAVVAGV